MSSSNQISVSIIIPVYNDTERLALCLDAITRQSYEMGRVEVLVIDNGSEQPPEEEVNERPGCRLLHESQPGSYAARNRGLDEAVGERLVFTDADCIPEPDWLAHGLAHLEAAPAGAAVVGGAIEVFAAEQGRPTSAELYDIATGLRQDRYVASGFAATANLFTTRPVMQAVGEFNADLKSSGDAEWGHRASDAGWPLVYAADAIIRHPARTTLGELITKARRHAGGRMDQLSNQTVRPTLSRQLYLVFRMLTPHVSHIRDGLHRLADRGYGFLPRVRFVGVALLIQYTKVLEMVRTRLGGASVRR